MGNGRHLLGCFSTFRSLWPGDLAMCISGGHEIHGIEPRLYLAGWSVLGRVLQASGSGVALLGCNHHI